MFSTAHRLGVVITAVLAVVAAHGYAFADPPAGEAPPLSKDQTAALDRITADSLKGHLSFLASDLLEGRDTPSRGLDLAAEYIAAQFRRAGLEAIGDDGYFQTAKWELLGPPPTDLRSRSRTASPTDPCRQGAGELAAPPRVRREGRPRFQDRCP